MTAGCNAGRTPKRRASHLGASRARPPLTSLMVARTFHAYSSERVGRIRFVMSALSYQAERVAYPRETPSPPLPARGREHRRLRAWSHRLRNLDTPGWIVKWTPGGGHRCQCTRTAIHSVSE